VEPQVRKNPDFVTIGFPTPEIQAAYHIVVQIIVWDYDPLYSLTHLLTIPILLDHFSFAA
jgi:hypothetical protein